MAKTRRMEWSRALGIQVAQMTGLNPVSEDTKQQMAGQARVRLPPEYGEPTGPKLTGVEITQARYLDAEGVFRSGTAGPIFTRGMALRTTGPWIGEARTYRCPRSQSGRPWCRPPSSSRALA